MELFLRWFMSSSLQRLRSAPDHVSTGGAPAVRHLFHAAHAGGPCSLHGDDDELALTFRICSRTDP